MLVLKVIAPLFLGFLGLSIYFFAHNGLDWSPTKSLVPALLGTLYFVGLRVSWDQLRNELGLIFLFVVLTLLSKQRNSRKRYVLLSLAMVAVVLSHQLVAVIMLGIVVFTLIYKLVSERISGYSKSVCGHFTRGVVFCGFLLLKHCGYKRFL